MANQHRHPVRGLRGIPEDLWNEFEQAAKTSRTDRSTLIHEFIAWYLGHPGADLPKRPLLPPTGDSAD